MISEMTTETTRGVDKVTTETTRVVDKAIVIDVSVVLVLVVCGAVLFVILLWYRKRRALQAMVSINMIPHLFTTHIHHSIKTILFHIKVS